MFQVMTQCTKVIGVSGYDTVYEGSDREHQFEQLTPGHQYRVRVACCSVGGRSEVRPLSFGLASLLSTHTHTHTTRTHTHTLTKSIL